MTLEGILPYLEQYGYAALFFLLWLGIVGLPIADELIVMTGGFVTTLGILKPLPSFIATYAGVVFGLTLGYVIGRFFGAPALGFLARKKRMRRHIRRAQRLIDRYGAYSLIISYFFPIVRHVVPYIVGLNRMSYARYALFSYSTGFLWTLAFFIVGRYFGKYMEQIAYYFTHYGWFFVVLFLLIMLLVVIFKKRSLS